MTDRTRLRRKADRGSHDRAVIEAILDEALVCHVGFADGGQTRVLPSTFVRVDDHLYLHGAPGNHRLRTMEGAEVCVAVTLLDGLVLARSAFHHSMNYRSVVIYGKAESVESLDHKQEVLAAFVEHVLPGRGADARPPTDAELGATRLVRVPIDEASAKVRAGGPVEEPEDMALDVWAGEVPLALAAGTPVADEQLPASRSEPPAYVGGAFHRVVAGAALRRLPCAPAR